MRRFIALLLLVCICGVASKASAGVLITSDLTRADVFKNQGTVDGDYILNTGGTIAVATLPGYSSTTTSTFNSASLLGSYVQSRPGDHLGDSSGEVGTGFSTDVNVSYTAGGSFSNSAGTTNWGTFLRDSTTNSFLFNCYQINFLGPVAFTLGGAAGNQANYFFGSLTGTLLAGHTYQWGDFAYTQGYGPDDGATASGQASLTFGAVPEFSSVIVWSLLALTIGGVGWWRRSKLAA